MKPAAYVDSGKSLENSLPDLRKLGAKVFATAAGAEILQECGIHATKLEESTALSIIRSFGHREIHLFGFDLCDDGTNGARVCLENRVFYTTQAMAERATHLLNECVTISEKNVSVFVHGDGMFAKMVGSVLKNQAERPLTAVYDLNLCPPTYEIFSFLSQAEKYRAEHGFTAIDVVILPGPMHGFRDDDLPPGIPERVSMLNRICVAGAKFLPTVRNVHIFTARTVLNGEVFPPDWTNERPTACYGPRFQKNANRCLRASDAARAEVRRRFPRPFSTITMREAEYWPQRNSDFAAWSRAERRLRYHGVPAVVVPDTHGVGIPGANNFDAAAWDVDLRLALYEAAEVNFGVANGPMVLMLFAQADCPYVLFQKPAESTPTSAAFHAGQGVAEGEQWTDNGLTVWENDTPDAVEREVDAWFRRHIGAKAA